MVLQKSFVVLSLESKSIIPVLVPFRPSVGGSKKLAFGPVQQLKNCRLVIFWIFFKKIRSNLRPHIYLVLDSYSRPQTRESVESAKKWLEYESFEYESRLDTALKFS